MVKFLVKLEERHFRDVLTSLIHRYFIPVLSFLPVFFLHLLHFSGRLSPLLLIFRSVSASLSLLGLRMPLLFSANTLPSQDLEISIHYSCPYQPKNSSPPHHFVLQHLALQSPIQFLNVSLFNEPNCIRLPLLLIRI